jgi:DNA-binding GntR family transcriptional regulator
MALSRPHLTSPALSLGAASVRTSHEIVLGALRRAIVSGELPGGTHLVQTDLAAQLGVSATPVREALRDLVAEGLVELDRYRGAVVHEPTPAELREIYDMRIALEPLAIERIVGHVPAADRNAAADLIAAMDATDDVPTFVEHNRRFHELLVDLSGSPRLIATLRTLRDASALYVGASLSNSLGLMRSSNREHEELLDACVAGDGDRATAIVIRHLRATVDTILAPE